MAYSARMHRCAAFIVAAALSAAASAAPSRYVAVLPFQSDERVSKSFRESIEEAVRSLAIERLPDFVIMDGNTQLRILEEQGIDPAKACVGSCALEVAQKLNAELFLSGSVRRPGKLYRAVVRCYRAKSGAVLGSADLEGPDVDEMLADLKKQGDKLLGSLRQRGQPVSKEGRIGGEAADVPLEGSDEVVVKLESTPPGAIAMLDGKLLCQSTPCSKLIATGPHEFAMQKEGYDEVRETKTVARGSVVALSLPRADALLSVDTVPAGLAVLIDGAAAGKAPLAQRSLPPGAHEVVVEDRCYVREGERVVLKKGEERSLRIAPKPRLAALKLTAEDEKGNALEGKATLDGRELGPVPGQYKVSACAKSLVIEGAGGVRFAEELALHERETRALRGVLKRGGFAAGASGLTFVDIPGGTFQFQGERAVTIQPFRLGSTAVTVAAYARCVAAGACSEPTIRDLCNRGAERADHPINCVDWDQAAAFCKWIGGRLPTEEEREYVMSGGSEGRTYPWGSEETGARACWNGEGNDLGKGKRKTTCPVGSHPAGDGKWSLHDLAGNIWEWTSSDYAGREKAIRGGSYYDELPENHRARVRGRSDRAEWTYFVGLRCGQ